jgi:hypothetical protein
MDKSIRVIKNYELHELSLVDNPANQFANIVSIEKVNGQNVVGGYLSKAEVENVFWDSESGIVMISDAESAVSPTNGNKMQNIGFIEKNDKENTEMIKFLVDSAKGISTIKITKEVNPMTESTEAAVDAVVENAEVAPEAQPAEVVETPAVAEEVAVAEEAPVAEAVDGGADSPVAEQAAVEVEKAEEAVVDAVSEVKEEVAKAVSEINASLTNAFGDLAATIKSLNEQVAAVTKSLDTVTSDVNGIKSNFNEFGKRVDLVEQDTAFRKSGDLGEIVQESPQVVQKSLWGGRFLTNTDLFN